MSKSKVEMPSDLELMLTFDGELDSERRAEVERYLAGSRSARSKSAGLSMVSGILRENATAPSTLADGIADAVMAKIAEAPREAKAPPVKEKPANDNARTIWSLGALVAAAAAALLLWGRHAPPPEMPSADVHSAAAREVAPPGPAPAAASSAEPAQAAGDDPSSFGVEVAAVEFGARMGSIFYVQDEATSAATTVVWLADDAMGDE